MLCIYHIADHDGKGSAAIVGSLFKDVEFFGYDHNMQPPYDLVAKHDKIVICDIALPIDFMFEINETKDLIWIDHHISVINEYDEKMKTGKYKEIKGIRRVGTAAIELTWEYFYPDKPVPEGIRLLALNDIFNLNSDRVRPFEYAMQSLGVNRPNSSIWAKLINNELNIDELVEKGKSILSWIHVRNYRLVRGLAFESRYNGLKCICANMPQGYSEFFDSVHDIADYDFMVNFYMDKNNKWKMTFYTSKDNVDVSKIAAEFGGGGHQKAAGASKLDELPEFLKKHR